jgi:hypothetical protein
MKSLNQIIHTHLVREGLIIDGLPREIDCRAERVILEIFDEYLTQKRHFTQDYKFAHGCPANQKQEGNLEINKE